MTLNTDQQRAVDEIIPWYNSQSLLWSLVGAAGTGKTFLTNYIINQLPTKSVCVCAPTHKAKKVIERATNVEGVTLHSLLGYKPNIDLDKIDIHNVMFSRGKKDTSTLKEYKIIIVDEASMIPAVIFDDMVEQAKKYRVKILFIGDDMQLPPVNEERSKCFIKGNVDGISTLRQPARQSIDNPLSLLLMAFRTDIGDMDARGYLINGLTELGLDKQYPTLIKDCSERFEVGAIYKSLRDCTPIFTNEHGGYVLTTDEPRFVKHLVNTYLTNYDENPEYCKVLCYKNDSVSSYNKTIREQVFSNPESDIIVGDRLMSYKTISRLIDKRYIPTITNTEEYSVESVEDIETHELIKARMVSLQANNGNRTNVWIVDPKDYERFKRTHKEYLDAAKANRTLWGSYYAFKDSHLILQSLNNKDKDQPVKDLDYAYGMTVHKSQGSTYDEVFVDVRDIREAYNIGVKHLDIYLPKEEFERQRMELQKFAFRLMYVAFSRPRFKAFGLI